MGAAGFGRTDTGALLKYDRHLGTNTSIELESGVVSGEAVFVSAEGATDEDDGYLMTFLYNAEHDTSEYVIFDAQTMSSDPIARVPLPRIPSGFHGSWIPA